MNKSLVEIIDTEKNNLTELSKNLKDSPKSLYHHCIASKAFVMRKISPFAAMREAGITRNQLRAMNKAGRIFAWMLVVANLETAFGPE